MAVQVIPYRMFNKFDNLGDSINPAIIKSACGLEPMLSRGGRHLLGIGSVVQMANRDSHVWGSGVMWPDSEELQINPERVFALRGTRTRDHLHRLGLLARDVPLGDPGFLIRRLMGEAQPKGTIRRLGIVPHHSQADSPTFAAFRESAEVNLIDMRTRSLQPLWDMLECDAVISQSLHGLIFAEALGIPNLWIASDDSERWTFKFHDWFSTTRHPQASPVMFRAGLPLAVAPLVQQVELHDCTIDPTELVASLPVSSLSQDAPQEFVAFQEGRARPHCRSVSDALVALHGIRLDDLNPDERKRSEAIVRRLFNGHFKDWAEPRYLLVAPAGINPTDKELETMVSFLNSRPDIPFLFVSLSSDNLDAHGRKLEYKGCTIIMGQTIGASALLLRPNGMVTFSSPRLATFIL